MRFFNRRRKPSRRRKPGNRPLWRILIAILFILVLLAFTLAFIYNPAGFKNTIDQLGGAMLSLAGVVGGILLLGLIGMIIHFLSSSSGTVVLPFEVHIGDDIIDGKSISDALIVELRRIDAIHHDKYEGIDIKTEKITSIQIAPEGEKLDTAMADALSVGMGGTTISIGNLLLLLKRMWPLAAPGTTISGSLQRYGYETRLIARLEDQQVSAWDVRRMVNNNDDIAELIRDLAYKIALERFHPEAKTWRGFKYFTEALNAYADYIYQGRQPEDLEVVRQHTVAATKAEVNYKALAPLFYNLGLADLEMKHYSQAEAMLNQARGLDSDHLGTTVALGVALEYQEKAHEAQEIYHQAIDQYNYEGKAALQRMNAQVSQLQEAGDTEAVNQLRAEIEATTGNYTMVYNNLGGLYLRASESDKARAAYLKAVEIDANVMYPHSNLGNLYASLGQNEDALREYKLALDIAPNAAEVYSGRGTLYFLTRDYGRAKADFENAVRLSPDFADAHYRLGILYAALNQPEEAIAEYKQAIHFDPLPSNVAGYHVSMAAAYRHTGNQSACDEQIRQAREIMAHLEIDNLYGRGCMEAVAGNTAEAIRLMQEALDKKQIGIQFLENDPDLLFIQR